MKKDYTKPLLEIKEYEMTKTITALTISSSPMNWTAEDNESGYKEFEW